MKHLGKRKHIIAVIMAIILTFSALPRAVFALEGTIYRRISSPEALTSGEYVLLSGGGFAPQSLSDGWITAVRPAVENDTVTEAMGAVWTLTVTEDGIILRDANGTPISPAADEQNAVTAGEYLWQAICTDDLFSFYGFSGDTPVTLAQNADYGFRAYDDASIAGNPAGYFSAFSLYAAVSETPEEETPPPSSEESRPSQPPDEETPTTVPSEAPTPVRLPEPGEYVLWDPAHNAALSSQRTRDGSQYYKGTSVIPSETGLSSYGNTDIWTLAVTDGTLTLTSGGETLGMKEGHSGISYPDGAIQWTAAEENGGWYIQNAANGWYIRYNWELDVWLGTEEKAQASALRLTPARRQAEPEPEPEKKLTAPVTISPDGGSIFVKETAAITLSCETEGAVIYYSISTDGITYNEYTTYNAPLVLQPGFGSLHIKAYSHKEDWEPGEEILRSFTELTAPGAGLYFGQLHSHSSLSDGEGSVREAFAHAANVEDLDFLAVTDHSNSLTPEEWAQGKAAADAAGHWDFVAIYGYEMTWEEGRQLGHINTFNTSEIYSREQPEFSDQATALPNYYAAISALSGSVSQFNHPGETYGDFQGFAHYSESADRAITLLELGSDLDVTYYARALDAGWHVAPTYSQNNHNGNWGSADNGRTAVFADSLTEAGIYEALSSCRVYATQDNDLSIIFTLDGYAMGTQLEKRDVGSTVNLTAALSDPTDGVGGTVEVIVEGGRVLSRSPAGAATNFALSSDHEYYFLRIIQSDGDIAVTAPIWIDTTEDVGIAAFTSDTAVPVQDQVLNLNLALYNNESCDLVVEKITFSIDGETVHETNAISRVKAMGTAAHNFPLKYSGLGQRTVTAIVTATLDGQSRTYEKTLTLNFQRSDLVNRIIVDASHGNAGVGQLDNLISLAAGEQITVTRAYGEITAQMLGSAKILMISAPKEPFEEDFLSLVRDFAQSGGTVILCGQADSEDTGLHTSAELNRLLSAMGSSLRLRDDTARDPENCGDSTDHIFPANFNTASEWCGNITENQVYSHKSGCTVDTGRGTWLVKGHPTTDSMDADGDGLPTAARGEAVLLACEEINGGTIFAAGSFFLTDAHTGEGKNIWDEPYANRAILQALLGSRKAEFPLSAIGDVRNGVPGEVFRIRGYVTAGTSNPHTTFPDTLYLQDDTGGIAVMPFAKSGIEIGTPMEVTGYLDSQNGNLTLEVMEWQVLSLSSYRYVPETISNRDAMDYAARGGQLLQVSGEVVEVTATGDSGISRFVIEDDKGDLATVWIEDAIRSGSTGTNTLASQVKSGRTVRAIGLLHIHSDGTTVLRVRNCDEVVYIPPLAYTPERQQDNPSTEDALVLYLLAIPLTVTALILLKRRRENK